MPIPVRCTACGATFGLADDLAGATVKCPACGGPVVVASAQMPGVPPAPPPAPPGAVPQTYFVTVDSGVLTHVKLIGIFNIIAGALTGLWALFSVFAMIFVPIAMRQGPSQPMPPGVPANLPIMLMVVLYSAMGVLCAITSPVLIAAGVKVLKRRPGARKWAFAAGILSCVSVWNYCCVWPVVLASGIYTLIAVSKPGVRAYLEQGAV